jgi:hypothetical protein
MEHSPNNTDLDAVFNGIPVIVRLITGDDIICVLYQRTNDADDPRMFMERPLRLLVAEIGIEPAAETTIGKTNTLYSKVRTRFDRWIPMTDATMFPVFPDHIVSIAPIADQYVHPYMEWADQLYQYPEELVSPQLEKQAPSTDELRKTYIDFLLHNFNPKGKPN